MLKTIGNRLNAYILIFLLVCGGPFLVLVMKSQKYMQENFWPRSNAGFMNGEPSAKFDTVYKAEFPLKELSVTLLNVMSYALFHETRRGAIIGRDGWIFTDEEFVWNSGSAGSVEKHISDIFVVEAKLASRGVRLAVVLVPQKATIYPEYLGGVRIPLEQEQLYDAARQTLSTHPEIILPEVKAALVGEKSTADVFLKTDTHWSVDGAGAVASVVAKSILPALLGEPKTFKQSFAAPKKHNGDLLKFVNLGRWSSLLPVREDIIKSITVTSADASVDEFLATSTDKPNHTGIILVGTSYSANALWSFQPQLEMAMGVNIINRAEEGKGYVAPMKSLLETSSDELKNSTLVIWEIPVRYLVADQLSAR